MSEYKEIDGVLYKITPIFRYTQEEIDSFISDKEYLQTQILDYPKDCSPILKKAIDEYNEKINNSILYIDNILLEYGSNI